MSSAPIRNILPENANRHTEQDCCGDKNVKYGWNLELLLAGSVCIITIRIYVKQAGNAIQNLILDSFNKAIILLLLNSNLRTR